MVKQFHTIHETGAFTCMKGWIFMVKQSHTQRIPQKFKVFFWPYLGKQMVNKPLFHGLFLWGGGMLGGGLVD